MNAVECFFNVFPLFFIYALFHCALLSFFFIFFLLPDLFSSLASALGFLVDSRISACMVLSKATAIHYLFCLCKKCM